jgi:hypothetical protein
MNTQSCHTLRALRRNSTQASPKKVALGYPSFCHMNGCSGIAMPSRAIYSGENRKPQGQEAAAREGSLGEA